MASRMLYERPHNKVLPSPQVTSMGLLAVATTVVDYLALYLLPQKRVDQALGAKVILTPPCIFH